MFPAFTLTKGHGITSPFARTEQDAIPAVQPPLILNCYPFSNAIFLNEFT